MVKYYPGIDIGSVAVSIALMNGQKRIIHTGYSFHKGKINENLLKLLSVINVGKIKAIGFTTSGSVNLSQGKSVDPRIALITAAKHFHPEVQSLHIIGAEKFGLVTFDRNGEYRNFRSNSSCAAGTGNFLDQQAERLNLPDIMEFSRMAWENRGNYPKIASRCAVFAKTDLIHAQQEGYSLSEICDGLSYGLAKNIVDTVFLNQTFPNVVAAGGVALNKAVTGHVGRLIRREIIVDDYANVYGAVGAYSSTGANETKEVYLGIDIGSTSNKADYIFLPVYLEESRETKPDKQYCYYTQFVSSVISTQNKIEYSEKLLTPHLRFSYGELSVRFELFWMIESIGFKDIGIIDSSLAWEKAKKQFQATKEVWSSLYHQNALAADDIHIMLLGRPYTVLSPAMNNYIPYIFEKMGVEPSSWTCCRISIGRYPKLMN
jgi:activator of 2-hydroxyglutaryl-CoA dehydratase